MERLPPDVEEWIGQWPTGEQEQIRWFVERVGAADERITGAIKWRRLTFTVEGNGDEGQGDCLAGL